MQTTTKDGKTFTLKRETAVDQQFIDALDHERSVHVVDMLRGYKRGGHGGYENIGTELAIDHAGQQALRDDAGRQALSAIGELIRLGLREAAQHGHVSAPTADPQAQKQFSASFIQFQIVLDAFREVVIQAEIVLKEVQSAHIDSPVVETSIVKE